MSTESDAKTHTVEFSCDTCGESVMDEGVYGADDFQFAWNEHRKEGWAAFSSGGVWKHKCPDCVTSDMGNNLFEDL